MEIISNHLIRPYHVASFGVGLWCFILAGCIAPGMSPEQADRADCPASALSDLAGDWDVDENGIIVPLAMDPLGFGRYEWQQGTIETNYFDGRIWRGLWNQPGNDRNGGFEVRLSDDRNRAEGQWWYLRIGEEHYNAKAKGGAIALDRITPVVPVAPKNCP
jgi:hypothetical protein